MTLGRRSTETMKLTAFRLDEVELDRTDAQDRPVFRHRRSFRARLARLAAWWAAAWTDPNNQRPSDRYRA
jgi:hypothetical protein